MLYGFNQCCGSMTFWCGSGSAPLTNGSGSFYFHHWHWRCHQKTSLKKSFFCLLLIEGPSHNFSKIKSIKKSQNSRNQGFSHYFCLMIEGSGPIPLTNGSGSRRPKNMKPADLPNISHINWWLMDFSMKRLGALKLWILITNSRSSLKTDLIF